MLPIQAVSQDVAEKMALQSIEGFKRSDTKVSYIFVCFCAKPLLEFRQCSKVRMSESKYAQKRTARRSRNHKGRVIGVSALDDHTDTQWVNEGLKWLKDRPGMGSFIL